MLLVCRYPSTEACSLELGLATLRSAAADRASGGDGTGGGGAGGTGGWGASTTAPAGEKTIAETATGIAGVAAVGAAWFMMRYHMGSD